MDHYSWPKAGEMVVGAGAPRVQSIHLPWKSKTTLPETNIAPENGWLEYWFPFGMAYFQGLCLFQGVY